MSLRTIWIIWKRETASFFLSPIAYIVAFFYLLLTGFSFFWSAYACSLGPADFTVMEAFFQNLFIWIAQLLVMPILSMRTFSEEYRLGTFEGLMTAPVRDWEVVLGKYLAVLTFYVALWIPTLLYQFLLKMVVLTVTPLAAGPVWGSYLIILLMGMFYAAIGLLASSVTRNQIIAVIISGVCTSLFFFSGLLNFLANPSEKVRNFIDYISAFNHNEQFHKGLVSTQPIVFYISMTVMLLFITQKIIESRRWKT